MISTCLNRTFPLYNGDIKHLRSKSSKRCVGEVSPRRREILIRCWHAIYYFYIIIIIIIISPLYLSFINL